MKIRNASHTKNCSPDVTQVAQTTRTVRGTKHGFSLVEILVVLVILLIGILAIVRLFPGGFLTIQRTGETTSGGALVSQQLDAFKGNPFLPENIFSGTIDSKGDFLPLTLTTPDDLTDVSPGDLPANTHPSILDDLYFASDINRIKYVQGETFPIPVGTPNGGATQYGSVYTLQLNPVFNQFHTAPSGELRDSIVASGLPMSRLEQSALSTNAQPDPTAPLVNEDQYAIDYDNGKIAFFPRLIEPNRPTFRTFVFRYDYYTTDTPPQLLPLTANIIVNDIDPTTLAAGVSPRPLWVDIFDGTNNIKPANFMSIRRESDDVSRRFRLVTLTPLQTSGGLTANEAFTDDPYEYAWYTNNGANNANVGVLVFNPRGHVNTNPGGGSVVNQQSLKARVDYLIFDNHIIRDQRSCPSQSPYAVKLSLGLLLTDGDIGGDGTIYSGMYRGGAANSSPDIMIYNGNSGQEIAEYSVDPGDKTIKWRYWDSTKSVLYAPAPVRTNFDPKSGFITLDASYVQANNLQNAPLRIYYKTQKEWGMQVQKAAAHYTQTSTASDLLTKPNLFFIGDGTNGSKATRLYFSPSEAGKTVTLGEYYLSLNGNNNNTPYTHEIYQIIDNQAQFDTLNGSSLPYIDITDQHADIKSQTPTFTAQVTGRAISYVQGVSLKSRVIWRSSDRWRKIDNDTVLQSSSQ